MENKNKKQKKTSLKKPLTQEGNQSENEINSCVYFQWDANQQLPATILRETQNSNSLQTTINFEQLQQKNVLASLHFSAPKHKNDM